MHIPFCKKACHYCNFYFSTSLKNKEEFISALIKEITITGFYNNENNTEKNIQTIYFGGGTPSLLTFDELKQIIDALHEKFIINENAEITLEANPDDITKENLLKWKQADINRFSLGIQTFFDDELQWMNRAHTAKHSINCIDMVLEAGFRNYSIDLIYGSPLLSNEQWQQNVQLAIEKKVPHISCYALTVEPNTALAKQITLKKKLPVNADKQAEQFLLLMRWLVSAGYEHYEISNFALPGFRSKHNSSYWQAKPYYGFGPSAHSFDGTVRKWNVADNNTYISSLQKNIIPFEFEVLTKTQKLNEYIMTMLRTMEGVNLTLVKEQFGNEYYIQLLQKLDKHKHSQNILLTNYTLTLSTQGKLFADGIAADLFF